MAAGVGGGSGAAVVGLSLQWFLWTPARLTGHHWRRRTPYLIRLIIHYQFLELCVNVCPVDYMLVWNAHFIMRIYPSHANVLS
jgi:hypothetical protein